MYGMVNIQLFVCKSCVVFMSRQDGVTLKINRIPTRADKNLHVNALSWDIFEDRYLHTVIAMKIKVANECAEK